MKKLFGTDGIRGLANNYPLTPEFIVKIGKGVGLYFKKHHNNHSVAKVIIGKDTRISGYMIETGIISGLCSAGVNAYLVGPMPTPAIAHLVRSFAADGGIMISASHNPAEDNGIKVFNPDGYKLTDNEEEEIESLMEEGPKEIIGNLIGKAYRIDDARGRYIEFAKSSINNISLKGLKVVIDCANGASSAVTPKIIKELGAEVIVLNNKPNGININEKCGALHPEIVQRATVKEKADIGISLDGDADRVIIVDEKGNILDGDDILMMSALSLKEKNTLRKNTVVATIMSNIGLELSLKKRGIKLVRTKVGDRYIIEEMRKNGYNLGGEQSGHIIFSDYSTTGDGTITALEILKVMKDKGKKLSEFSKLLEKKSQVSININVREKKPIEKLKELTKKINDSEKILGKTGRVVVRYSGTQNFLRIMIEGSNYEQVKKLIEEIGEVAKKELA